MVLARSFAVLLVLAAASRAEVLLVAGYDDSRLPCGGEVAVVVRQNGREVARLESSGGWPAGVAPDEVVARFGAAGEGTVARVVLGDELFAQEARLEVSLEAQLFPAIGTPLGMPGIDHLETSPRLLPAQMEDGGSVEVFLGPLVHRSPIHRIRVPAPIFPEGGHLTLPLFTLHHRQRGTVQPLLPYQGGRAFETSIFPAADGGWQFFVAGSGSYHLGAYGHGYAEVKSDGFVVRPDDVDSLPTVTVAVPPMEETAWAIFAFDLESVVPLERCLGVEIRFEPQIHARDPMDPRMHMELLRLGRTMSLRPTHKSWIVRGTEPALPAATAAPYGLSGPSWSAARAELLRCEAAWQERASIRREFTPAACVRNGGALPKPDAHELSISRALVGVPDGFSAILFVGTRKALREMPMIVKGRLAVLGALAPEGDPSAWTIDHATLPRRSDPALTADVSDASIGLTPYCVTTFRISVDLGAPADKQLDWGAVTSEPIELPGYEAELAAPEASLSRHLSLPPSTGRSTESVTLRFDQPIDPRSVVAEVTPREPGLHQLPTVAAISPTEISITYEYWPLPRGEKRTVALRPGIRPLDSTVMPLQRRVSWVVDGDLLAPHEK